MIAKYNVIDIANLCEGMPKKQMYLILSRDSQKAKCPRKIMISKERILNINYFEDEEVQVLIWDEAVRTYKCKKVLLKGGNYRVDSIINMLFPKVSSLFLGDWDLVLDFFHIFTEELTITNHVITTKGYDSELRVLTDIKVEDSNLLLKRVECRVGDTRHVEGLFNKCIYGDVVNVNDLEHIVDDVEGDGKMHYVSIEFNNMIFNFNVEKETILVQMFMGSQDKINETVSVTLSIGRVGGMVSFLLSKLTEIENIEDKMKYLTGRVIY